MRFPARLLFVATCLTWNIAHAQQHNYPNCFGHNPIPTAEAFVTFDRVFEGNYNPGQPYDVVTIAPDGSGETFEEMGITIRLRFTCPTTGWPIVGVPADVVQIWSNTLCLCEAVHPAGPSDADGWTEFTGSIAGGGCADQLDVFAAGIYMATLPIKVNSTDTALASACATDASDLAEFATKFGTPGAWDICFDYDESGPPIDAADLAFFASVLGAACTR